MSRAGRRQSQRAHSELEQSWGDVDYEESSNSDSEFGGETKDSPGPLPGVYASKDSPQRGSRQQLPLSLRLRSQILTAPSTTKRTNAEIYTAPTEPTFVMPSPSTLSRSATGVAQQSTRRRSSRRDQESLVLHQAHPRHLTPTNYSPPTMMESLEDSWVDASPPKIAQQSGRQQFLQPKTSLKGSSYSQKPCLSSQTQGGSQPSSAWTYLDTAWDYFLAPTVTYVLSVMKDALQLVRPLLGYLLLAFLVHFFFWKGKSAVDAGIRMALSPVCNFPGASYLSLPFCPTYPSKGHESFASLIEVQKQFEDVARYSTQATGIRRDMKDKEMAMADLKSVISFSSLSSRQELIQILNSFILGSKQSGQDFSRFNAGVDFALDKIVALNQYTIQVMEGLDAKEDGMGWLERTLASMGLSTTRHQTAREVMFDQYVRQASGIEEEVKRLIHKADNILKDLDSLELQLNRIHDIAIGEEVATQEQRDQLFATLYSRLGGNQREKRRMENNLRLLGDVQTSRHRSYTIISNTLRQLQDIENYLENLREEMGRPQEDGFKEVPMEVHLARIRLSVGRLEDLRETKKNAEAYIRAEDDKAWEFVGMPVEATASTRTASTMAPRKPSLLGDI